MNNYIINIVCTIDQNYIQHCGVMLCSLFFNNQSTQFRVYILTDNESTIEIKRLTNLVEKYGHQVSIICIDKSYFKNVPISNHVTEATYYRLLIPKVLSSVSKVLFLDPDIIIRSEIKDFWDTNITYYALAAAKDYSCQDRKVELNIPNEYDYFNAGVLLMNLDVWRKKEYAERIFHFIKDNPDKLKFWDQDAINACIFKETKIVSNQWNATAYFFKRETRLSDSKLKMIQTNPSIVHYTGSSKPWHLTNEHPFKTEYYHYLKKTPWRNFNPYWYFIKFKLKQLLKK